MIRIDDIIASLLLALSMMRRLELLGASRERNPQVSPADFEHWRQLGLSGYRLCASACLLKVVLSSLWFWSHPPQPLLQIGGFSLFIVWVVALVVAWRRTTEAAAVRRDLNIDTRRS